MLLRLGLRICRLRLRGRRRGRGRGCQCYRGGRLRTVGWRIGGRWWFRGLFGPASCDSLLRCGGICPGRRVNTALSDI